MKITKIIATALVCCIIFSTVPNFVSAAVPVLKEGNHADWIDRIGDMPQYALDFYDWLEENSLKGGALRTAQGETNFSDGTSAHLVAEIQGTTNSFSFPVGSSDSAIQTNAINSCKENRDAIIKDAQAFTFATIGAFDRDHPEVFWLSGNSSLAYSTGYSWAISRSTGYGECTCVVKIYYILKSSTVDIRTSDYSTAAKIDETNDIINDCIDNILSGNFPENGTSFEKIKYLNKWLTKNNCFNTTTGTSAYGINSRECVSALVGSVGTSGPICEGYSRAFKVLCDRIGIPCVLVDGTAFNGTSSGGHMWNYVQMENGKWYAVDVTWNDPTVAGVSSAVSGHENEKYFLVGSSTKISGTEFIVSHPVSNVVYTNGFEYTNGPVLSELSYQEDIAIEENNSASEPTIDGGMLHLANAIDAVLLVKKDSFEAGGFTNPTVKAEFDGVTYELMPNVSVVDGEDCYSFTFKNVPIQRMNDSISAILYAEKDGESCESKSYEFSVASYAYEQLRTTTDSKLKTLLVDLINYGSYAQLYTKYNSQNLVNAALTTEQAAWGTQTLRELVNSESKPSSVGDAVWTRIGLIIESKVDIMGYFSIPTSMTGVTVRATDSDGNLISVIRDFEETQGANGVKNMSFVFDKLTAKNMSDVVGFTVYNSQGVNISGQYLFSIESAAQKNQNSTNAELADFLKAMMIYGDSARAYEG